MSSPINQSQLPSLSVPPPINTGTKVKKKTTEIGQTILATSKTWDTTPKKLPPLDTASVYVAPKGWTITPNLKLSNTKESLKNFPRLNSTAPGSTTKQTEKNDLSNIFEHLRN